MYITVIYEKCGEGAFIRGGAFIRDNTVGLYQREYHFQMDHLIEKFYFTFMHCVIFRQTICSYTIMHFDWRLIYRYFDFFELLSHTLSWRTSILACNQDALWDMSKWAIPSIQNNIEFLLGSTHWANPYKIDTPPVKDFFARGVLISNWVSHYNLWSN